jgi:uncharacterized Zn finger protein
VTPPAERPWNLWDESPPPIPVEDGLSAVAKPERLAGGLGSSIVRKVLDRSSPGIANRGRGYARAGQTVSLDFAPGRISGEVQGSDPDPYQTEITFPVSEVDGKRFVRALHGALPEPVTEIPEAMTRDLRAELAEYRILIDAPVTVKCNCSYRGVCKHLVAFAYVAGERLDASPRHLASVLDITNDDVVVVVTDDDIDAAAEPETPRFDRKRQTALARTLSSLDNRESPTRDEVLSRAAEILMPSAAVANALDLDLYLDPIEPEAEADEE